jgi:hypothetical protein
MKKFDKRLFKYRNHVQSITFDADSEMADLPTIVFWSCSQMKKCTFPPKIRTIGDSIFDFDRSILENFATVEPNQYWKSDYHGAYYRRAAPKFLILQGWPTVTHRENVTFDAGPASEIISISREVFQHCREMKRIGMGNLTLLRDIEWQTFFHCSVEVLVLPRDVRHIECSALSSPYLKGIVIDSN